MNMRVCNRKLSCYCFQLLPELEPFTCAVNTNTEAHGAFVETGGGDNDISGVLV